MRTDWPRFEAQLDELLEAMDEYDPHRSWLHVRDHRGAILSWDRLHMGREMQHAHRPRRPQANPY